MKKNVYFMAALILISFTSFLSTTYSYPVIPVSYDMLNGGSDSYAYWDGSYSSPNNKTSYAWLAGGLGDLTDGIIADDNYYRTENVDGTGPYVGWDLRITSVFPEGNHPTITFNFSAPVNIGKVSIHVDNANTGRVSLPMGVDISMGGTVRSYDIGFDNVNLAPRWIDFPGLDLYGSSLALTLYDRSYAYDWPGYSAGWVMLSEVAFDSGTSIPEPSTMFLLGSGLLGLAGLRRKFSK